MGIFARSLSMKKKTMVFVDYEYWFYSYKTLYKMRPDIITWRDELYKSYNIEDIMIFGDFESDEMRYELGKLREVTSNIIETGNVFQHYKKDVTDFVMIDYIYQCASKKSNIGRYVIFTGDGHFQSVVRYLVQKKKCEVVVYGVRDSMSKYLRDAATLSVELPSNIISDICVVEIIKNMAHVYVDRSIIPTFMVTVDSVSRLRAIPKETVSSALINLINRGYIYQKTREVEPGKAVKVLAADWERIAADGILEKVVCQ